MAVSCSFVGHVSSQHTWSCFGTNQSLLATSLRSNMSVSQSTAAGSASTASLPLEVKACPPLPKHPALVKLGLSNKSSVATCCSVLLCSAGRRRVRSHQRRLLPPRPRPGLLRRLQQQQALSNPSLYQEHQQQVICHLKGCLTLLQASSGTVFISRAEHVACQCTSCKAWAVKSSVLCNSTASIRVSHDPSASLQHVPEAKA